MGSSCDLFAKVIPVEYIYSTLAHCSNYEENKYLFQSKNPERIYNLRKFLPEKVVLGTTIETNRIYPEMGDAPPPRDRAWAMFKLQIEEYQTMITVEPIIDFDGVLSVFTEFHFSLASFFDISHVRFKGAAGASFFVVQLFL